ncbi:unnamed protein product [Brassica oleracea var. botrytis]
MSNPWLTFSLASPLDPTAPAGNLSRPPLLPDPPDPANFPPLPSSRSSPPKPFVRPSSTVSVPTAGTVPPSSSTQNTIPDLETHTTCPAPTPLPISFTTQLLAAYSSSIFPLPDQNPRSDQKLRSSSTDTNSAPQISSSFPNFGILPAPITPPLATHTPPKDPLPIQFSPTKAPSMIMEIDTDPLPSDNDEIIIIDDTGPYVLGLAAVFKDRPITSVSTKFGSLPPSPCITSLNPFAPLLTSPSSSDQPSSSSKTRVSFPPETLTPPLPISSSPVQIITPPSTTKPLVVQNSSSSTPVTTVSPSSKEEPHL